MYPNFLKIFMALGLIAFSFAAFAQDDGPAIPPERLQEIKAQKSAFITQRLHLTPEESRAFWPIYDKYQADMEASRMENRAERRDRRAGGAMTEAEASKAIDGELQAKQAQLDLRKRYVAEFKKTIGAVKTLQLGEAERDFNRELLKRIRERNATGRGR
jgi:Mg-chelatase subunit ChlI